MRPRKPFKLVVSWSQEQAAEWATPSACYAVDYLGQADLRRFPFGVKRYRVWLERATDALREEWDAA